MPDQEIRHPSYFLDIIPTLGCHAPCNRFQSTHAILPALSQVLPVNSLLALISLACSWATPEETAELPPAMLSRCVSCHGPAKQRGGLRLDSAAHILRGGDSGPAIAPTQIETSLLLRRVRSTGEDRMPPAGPPLSNSEIEALSLWIGSAKGKETSDERLGHWSFQPLKKAAPPARKDGAKFGNPIDSFVLYKLDQSGLTPSAPADRRTLLRRLYLDLTGLSPSPDELDSFAIDKDPQAYKKRVELLLASPRHAERWARHWLDTVRFAESNGFETNTNRPNAWPYRDWVIKSFWNDLPYDEFVMKQIAGDVLGAPEATGFLVGGPWDQVKSPDPVLTAQQRADELHDMVGTTGSAFMGLTLGCARCHNHKFDPISQVDYHAVTAAIAGTRHGEAAMPPTDTARPRLEALRQERTSLELSLVSLEARARPAVSHLANTDSFKAVPARYVRMTITRSSGAEPCIDEFEVFDVNGKNIAQGSAVTVSGTLAGFAIHQAKHLVDGVYGNDHSWISNQANAGSLMIDLGILATIKEVRWSRDRSGNARTFTDRVPEQYTIEVSTDSQKWQTVASSVDRLPRGRKPTVQQAGPPLTSAEIAVLEKINKQIQMITDEEKTLTGGARVYAGTFTDPGPLRRFNRGDPTQPQEVVTAGVIKALMGSTTIEMASMSEPQRRLALARWIASPNNPLTARVIVNRLWQHHFGEGLVSTSSDFGRNGAAPSHPELLDFLASQLIANKWSLRSIHSMIVTSATYQQSSDIRPEAMAKDAGNRLLWRYQPRRLEAEAIRDGILAVSGNLDLTMFGPGFDLFEPNSNYVKVYTPKKTFGPAEWRRMIYQSKPRMQLDDIFGNFDCPDAGQIAPKRSRSITPLQALALLNSPFMAQQSDLLAKRLEREAPDSSSRIHRLFQLINGRDPDNDEKEGALDLVNHSGLPSLCRAMLNSSEWLFIR